MEQKSNIIEKTLKVPIIPDQPTFYREPNASKGRTLALKSICLYTAFGFFLDQDTFYKEEKTLRPGATYQFNDNNQIVEEKSWFKWYYSPREITFEQALEEYALLFEKITTSLLKPYHNIILPLSGGLDSRTQAAVLKGNSNVFTYSYEFAGSFNETKYAIEISKREAYNFKAYTIPKSYLWDNIEQLATLNGCYSEFTHPRQMAIYDEFKDMGDVFFLGHWGDVLFDDMHVSEELSFEQQVDKLLKGVVKKGGLELGTALWEAWGLVGSFKSYLRERVESLLSNIDIDNVNARVRAFKSLYWAPKWTSINLCIFSAHHPIVLPYYSNEMCEFICRIPERYLAGRQMQIAYIKNKAPELASIPWQDFDPCNLYNYHDYYTLKYFPFRALRKIRRLTQEKILNKKLILRNWENQFLGVENDLKLQNWLFETASFKELVPTAIVRDFYNKFKSDDPVRFSHSVSMLLTLAVWSKLFWKKDK